MGLIGMVVQMIFWIGLFVLGVYLFRRIGKHTPIETANRRDALDIYVNAMPVEKLIKKNLTSVVTFCKIKRTLNLEEVPKGLLRPKESKLPNQERVE